MNSIENMKSSYRTVTTVGATRALAAFLGILAAVLLAVSFQAGPAAAITATCTDSLQAKIDAAPSGGTVTANPCIYREQVTIKKPITLKGQTGTEIRGSDVWSGFSLLNNVYVSTQTVPSFPDSGGRCKTDTSDCLNVEQVFLDGKPLKQVADGTIPSSGQFSLDAARHVVLAGNPAGKTVEVSVRSQWVRGGASGVTIKSMRMKHAANNAVGQPALTNNSYANWTLQDSILSDTHGTMVGFGGASGLNILRNHLFQGGHFAVSGSYASVTLYGNKIHHNNVSGFDPAWEGGGVKHVRMNSVTAQNNQVYNNDGNGLWCDADCGKVVYRGNRVHHNTYSGMLFELSDGAKIYDNVVYENGWGKTPDSAAGSWNAAIHVTNSRNAEIYNNTVAWNRSNISLVRTDRKNAVHNDVYGNYVHDNQILSKDYSSSLAYNAGGRNHALAWMDKYDGAMYLSTKNNRGHSNDYFFATPENSTIPRFMWDAKGISSLSAFNATRGEEQGRYLTQSEKDSIVTNKGIPASPEH